MSNFKTRMSGNPTHLYFQAFEIVRRPGHCMGLPSSKYCYSFRYKGKEIRLFEYQHEARTFLDDVVVDLEETRGKILRIEAGFANRHGLPEFPKTE